MTDPATHAQVPALWHLLHLSDQFFPTGGYAFSHALETYVAMGLLPDRTSCQQMLSALCEHAIGPCDLVFCAHAYRLAAAPAALADTLAALCHADQMLAAYKIPRELRLESQQTGQAFLRAALTCDPLPLMTAFWQEIRHGRTPGHHALAFGMVMHGRGVAAEEALLAYLYTVTAGLVATALRLVPLGQSDGQRLLHDLAPVCADVLQRYRTLSIEDAWSCTPGLDIRSMQHERLYSRLCRS